MRSALKLSLSARLVGSTLLGATVVLNLIYLGTAFLRHHTEEFFGRRFLIRAFHVGQENNIPTWFSILLLALAATLLTLIAKIRASESDPDTRLWRLLAAIFWLLSLDEAASLHESVGDLTSRFIQTGGIFYYAWVIPGMAFVVIVVAVFWRFVWRLPRAIRNMVLASGILFCAGAIGFEMAAAPYMDERSDMVFSLLILAEELLEMTGIVLFIYALMRYLEDGARPVELSFASE